jgi:group I intron endonuclease
MKYKNAKSGIYLIVNNINGKFYIGSTTNDKRRWYTHRRELTNNTHSNPHLQRAWNKYGSLAFSFELIYECPVDALLKIEEAVIQQYFGLEMCYNMNRSAQMPGLGRVWTDESKTKLSTAQRGKRLSTDHIERLRGIKPTSVSRMKMRLAALQRSQETRKKLSISAKKRSSANPQLTFDKVNSMARARRTFTEAILEHQETKQQVVVTNITDFASKYNLHGGHVSEVIGGHRKSHNGWTLITKRN